MRISRWFFALLGAAVLVGAVMAPQRGGVPGAEADAALAVSAGVGGSHTCALTATGGVKCWGANAGGQLGNGTFTDSNVPVNVTGLTSGVAAVSSGGRHTCAVTTAGGLKCWGINNFGQLGNSITVNMALPGDVNGMTSGVMAVSAGNAHTCALTTAGGLKCWGSNFAGQLGNGTYTQSLVPSDVSGLASGVAAVSAGRDHTCAVTTAGGLKCWGTNVDGQLATGAILQSNVPFDISGLTSGVAAVSVGYDHTCVITTGGALKCWGSNNFGQLGRGTTFDYSLIPTDVSGLTSGVAAVSSGTYYTCAVTTGGAAKCWGANGYGQLGNGSVTQSSLPLDASGLTSGAAAVSTGYVHACALTTAGALKCWGANGVGQLGNAATANSSTPAGVNQLASGVAAVSTSWDHTCAVTTAGGLKCWGYNGTGQLGIGTNTDRAVPVDVTGMTSGVAAASTGSNHTCAVTTAGGAKCWGYNSFGELGSGLLSAKLEPLLSECWMKLCIFDGLRD